MIPFDIEDGGRRKSNAKEELLVPSVLCAAEAEAEAENKVITKINEEKKDEDMPLRSSDELDDMKRGRNSNEVDIDDDDDMNINNDRLSLLHDPIPRTTYKRSTTSKLLFPQLLFILLMLGVILSVIVMGIFHSRYR